MKIICIVQARMGSERLPGKVMRPILGKPMIAYTLERLKKSRYIDEVVLATSVKDTENEMVEYLESQNYQVFRGSEDYVLERYVDAVKKFGGDIVIRITGDCPLIDPVMVDQIITYYLANDFDYVGVDTMGGNYIRGFDVEIFTREALMKAYEETKEIERISPEKEHVTYYIYQHAERFKIDQLKASDYYRKNYRLCVDTPEDFALISNIYEHFQDTYVSAKEVIRYLDENPQIGRMNQGIKQKHV